MADEKNTPEGDEQEPKTRTRSTASSKSETQGAEDDAAAKRKAEKERQAEEKKAKDAEIKAQREAKRKEQEEKRAAEKEAREKAKAEEKERREQEKREKQEAKEREKVEARQAKIDAGEIIFASHDQELVSAEDANGDFEGYTYTLAEPKKELVAGRARSVILDLIDKAQEVPLSGKELADEYEGGTVQWVAFFGMLRVLGYVQPYRFKGGPLGESGLAYKWIGPTDDEFVNQLTANVEDAEVEPAAA